MVGYHAFIDCFKCQITLFTSEGDRIKFIGDQFDLSIPSLPLKGSWHPYLGNLINFMVMEGGTFLFELPPVVYEYLNIFVKDLSCLPPFRVINFAIDLMSRTLHNSIPLYHMAPAKLKELKL